MRCPFSALAVLASSMPMMRSASRIEETSGLTTTTATSACRIARVAPFSIPAGLSQITQSNCARNSAMTLRDPVLGQAVLVPALRGRQKSERVKALVPDEGLRELGLAFDDVDQVKDHAPLGTHHQVEIAQADIKVDDHHLLAALRQRGTQRCCRGGLADTALAGGHHQHPALSDLCLGFGMLWPWLLHRWHFSRETVRRHGTHAGTSEVERRNTEPAGRSRLVKTVPLVSPPIRRPEWLSDG